MLQYLSTAYALRILGKYITMIYRFFNIQHIMDELTILLYIFDTVIYILR